mmetsp:Transcript_14640/g.41850  ORF Transcript_14640/g.41850 Transcript_14640/m.41850 type:complete len:362 (-) Transcript_14640:3-1088(-)
MMEGNLPPPHNALRLWTLFTHQYPGGIMQPDELGDSCVGEAFRAEFCARVATCFRVTGATSGGGTWRVATPVQWASNYRLEAYLGDLEPGCLDRRDASTGVDEHPAPVAWWAPPVAEHVAPSRSWAARHAAFKRLRLLSVDKASWWWSQSAHVDPVTSWTEMMAAAIDAGSRSVAAAPARYGLETGVPSGLWLEFGVGSGQTTAAIATRLKSIYGYDVVLHGFDSFLGLPASWAHTKLGAGAFSTGGRVPEHLLAMGNVRVHAGLFAATLGGLGEGPVAFAHVDVDLYSSAVEVLAEIACRLHPGSVLVFDELVNYAGFELSGEYRAWEYVSAAYGIRWDYAGLYWQQSVPVVVAERGRAC